MADNDFVPPQAGNAEEVQVDCMCFSCQFIFLINHIANTFLTAISDYERSRLSNIERNSIRLAQLNAGFDASDPTMVAEMTLPPLSVPTNTFTPQNNDDNDSTTEVVEALEDATVTQDVTQEILMSEFCQEVLQTVDEG